MGQIADDMVNGLTCSNCSLFFFTHKSHTVIYEHGYPVICSDCWNTYTKAERKAAKRSGLFVSQEAHT